MFPYERWSVVPLACTAALLGTACRDGTPSVPGQIAAVDAGPDVRTPPGRPVSITARIIDPDPQTGSWQYDIDWGDGHVDRGSLSGTGGAWLTASHAYAAVGSYPIRVSAVQEQDADSGFDSLMAAVEPAGTPQVLVGAGDIGECGLSHSERTAELLDSMPGTVFTLGDNAYPAGSATDFATCYAPFWGRHKHRTHPAVGNHEYMTSGAAGYYGYFGVAAGDSTRGYYSYDLGDWHVIVLNSNIAGTNGKIPTAPEMAWLQADLAAHPAPCTLAMWHHPRFSSGTTHGSDANMQQFWQALYDAGADVVLSGHEHNYERFAPQTPAGVRDTARGIREFIVGTGGGGFDGLGPRIANSEASSTDHGVLKLTLSPGRYTWQFIPIPSESFRDSGSASCH